MGQLEEEQIRGIRKPLLLKLETGLNNLEHDETKSNINTMVFVS